MTERQQPAIRDILEMAMLMARSPSELLQWGKYHADLINQEMTDLDKRHLREVYTAKMSEFIERKQHDDKV